MSDSMRYYVYWSDLNNDEKEKIRLQIKNKLKPPKAATATEYYTVSFYNKEEFDDDCNRIAKLGFRPLVT